MPKEEKSTTVQNEKSKLSELPRVECIILLDTVLLSKLRVLKRLKKL
jgi:hypothetical protein